jgi:hypothetical protein
MLSTSKEATRQNLETFAEKSMFSTLKAKTGSKFVLWQLNEPCRFGPKSIKKSHRNTKSERKFGTLKM